MARDAHPARDGAARGSSALGAGACGCARSARSYRAARAEAARLGGLRDAQRRPPPALPADDAGGRARGAGGRARGAAAPRRSHTSRRCASSSGRAATCACRATCSRSASCTIRARVPTGAARTCASSCPATAPRPARLCWPGARSGATPCSPRRSSAFTERTSVGPESLRRELARTVARGYSIEDREYQPGTRGLAAPVFSSTGEAVAALAVVAPVERLQADRYGELGAAVMSAAPRSPPSSATPRPWRRRNGRVPEARPGAPRTRARGRARDRRRRCWRTSRRAARRRCATGRSGSTAGRRTRSS